MESQALSGGHRPPILLHGEQIGGRCTLLRLIMAFQITITEDAEQQFLALPVRDQRTLRAAIASRLQNQPTTLTRAIKQLRPNPLAAYELRAGDLRVLYNVEVDEVVIVVVGRKVGNRLIVAGEEYRGHQDDPSGSAGSGSEGNAE